MLGVLALLRACAGIIVVVTTKEAAEPRFIIVLLGIVAGVVVGITMISTKGVAEPGEAMIA